MAEITAKWTVKKVGKVFMIEIWITTIHQSFRRSWKCGSIHNYSHE